MDLGGKVALVTGASRGIGRSIALELAKNGTSVILNYRKDDEGANETLELIKKLGGYGTLYKTDISDYSSCKNMIDDIIKKFGKIDILINNAGISKIGLFMDMSEEDFNEIMNINFKGVFNCCHNAVKYMIERKSGVMINISSIWGNVGASCEVLYSASKGAINSFTRALAKELAPSNIRVNAIAPGVIDTDMNKCFSNEEREEIQQEIPMMRFGEGEDIAKLAVFLCGEGSKYITGQIVTVDGGML
ncbi:elongation factor P 5-aminopentanone reductase [Haloimpatiens sp. FM7330]|uniref:elongation factor P 5-aminopentanone reductase n=1 Tax=Haloimpatiens sp. FM7330 TaxID=3298610 RepID=UPI00364256B4